VKKLDAVTAYLLARGAAEFGLSAFYTVFMVYVVADLGFQPLQMVLVGTVLEGVYFVFEVPTGVVADLVSRRLSVIVGYGLLGISLLATALTGSVALILLLQVPQALGFNFLSGAEDAWLVDEIGDEAAVDVFMRATKVESIAWIAGIISTTLLGLISHPLAMAVGASVLLVLAGLLALLMPEDHFSPVPRGERTTLGSMLHTARGGFSLLKASPVLVVVAGLFLVEGLSCEGIDRLWTAHLIDGIGLPALPLLGSSDPVLGMGAISLVAALLIAVVAETLRQRVDLQDPAKLGRTLLLIYLGLTAGTFGFALSRSLPLALLFFWGMELGRGLTLPLINGLINQYIDSEYRATVLSMTTQTNSLGQMFGGPLVGWIGNLRSVRAALVAAALLFLPSLPLTGWIHRYLKEPSLVAKGLADDAVMP